MSTPEVRDKTAAKKFSQRLIEACDVSPNIPEYGRGRQVVIANELNISQEAVRKYFSGESMPKQDKMKKLATFLEVEQAWLALGEKSEVSRDAKRLAGKIADASVMFTAGTIQLAGGNCAFPPESDPKGAYIDIYAIIKGVRYDINVASARETSPGMFEITVPHEFKELTCIACVVWQAPCFDLLELSHDLIERHKVRRSVAYSVTINRLNGRYFTGEDEWSKFQPSGGNS